jgi:hypothetical protein
MTQPPPTTYQGTVLSARSRRLRTVGSLLLLAVIGMSLYGVGVLMPAINRSIAAHPYVKPAVTPMRARPAMPGISEPASKQEFARERLRRQQVVQVTFMFAYWGVCGLLVIAILFIAWLDLREVARNFADQHRALHTEIAEGMRRDLAAREGDPQK